MFSLLLAIIYLAFISLGLPDSLLGAGWPVMHRELSVPLSYAGMISMTIAAGTIVSSLQSDRLTRRFGTGKVTAVSVGMTAAALLGFSVSHRFLLLIAWAIPYGLGAGSVDASLNNYVALHYESKHMSWLHCMWGVGASLSPYVMRHALAAGQPWGMGYRTIGLLQAGLTLILFLSLPLWKSRTGQRGNGGKVPAEPAGSSGEASAELAVSGGEAPAELAVSGGEAPAEPAESGGKVPANQAGSGGEAPADQADAGPLSVPEILRIPGAKEVMLAFFCYCALEQTTGLWAASYLVGRWGMAAEAAAGMAALFFIGVTAGRAAGGFLAIRYTDTQMIRMGMAIIAAGLLLLLLPVNIRVAQAGFLLAGLGCAPVYPCIIHSTPDHFGAERSQAIIGVQMAFSYVGILVMPPLFGLLAGRLSTDILPVYLMLILIVMFLMHEKLVKKAKANL